MCADDGSDCLKYEVIGLRGRGKGWVLTLSPSLQHLPLHAIATGMKKADRASCLRRKC